MLANNQMTQETVVIGVFGERAAAERAIEALHAAGFTGEQIGFVMREAGAADATATSGTLAAEGAASGLVSGSLAGGLIVSVVAGALGFTGVARGAGQIAKILFGIFLVIALILFVLILLGIGAAV